jgi:hypothetical protein
VPFRKGQVSAHAGNRPLIQQYSVLCYSYCSDELSWPLKNVKKNDHKERKKKTDEGSIKEGKKGKRIAEIEIP